MTPDYAQLRKLIQTQLKQEVHRLKIAAPSLEQALDKAALQLSLPRAHVGYDIIKQYDISPDRPSSGVVISAYPLYGEHDQSGVDASREGARERNRDGQFSLRVTAQGILLRVEAAQGSGSPVRLQHVNGALSQRIKHQSTLHTIDTDAVQSIIKDADGDYHTIAPFNNNPAHDPIPIIDVDSRAMEVSLRLNPPGPQGVDLTAADIALYLRKENIIHGVLHDTLQRIEEHPQYGRAIKVAVGTRPQNGVDSAIQYAVEWQSPAPEVKEDKLHHRYFRPMANVMKDQVIATITPATQGIDGTTVHGVSVPASNGSEVNLKCGKGTKLIENGTKIVAEYKGQISFHDSIIEIHDTRVIDDDIGLKSGNVIFLGSLLIRGNVNDGFTVKASGRIEITGYVGKAHIDSEDDIVVHQGIAGKGGAHIHSDKNVAAKFIENATVHARNQIVVSDSIVNSEIWAGNKVVCVRKRASIIGGEVSATHLISAKSIGTSSGTAAKLIVGQDPFRQKYLAESREYEEKLQKQLRHYLLMERKGGATPSRDSQNSARATQERTIAREKIAVSWEIEKIKSEIEELQREIESTQVAGRISFARIMHAGTRVLINNVPHVIKKQITNHSLVEKGGRIKVVEYNTSDSATD